MSRSPVPDIARAVCSGRTHLRILSRPEWIDPTVGFLRRQAVSCGVCSEARAQKLCLVLREALLNALIHGNLRAGDIWPPSGNRPLEECLIPFTDDPRKANRSIDIVADYDGRRCQWTFTDEGPGFDVAAVLSQQEGTQPPEPGTRGRGIWIMRAFMDHVRFENGGRTLHLTLNRADEPEPRLSVRVPLDCPIDVVPIAGSGASNPDAACQAVCYSLSELGVVLLQRGRAPQPRVILGIPCRNRSLQVLATLTHAQQLDASLFEAAYRFDSRLDPDGPPANLEHLATTPVQDQEAMTTILQELQPPPPDRERRAYPRVTFTERVRIMGEPGTHQAFARDLSRSGIALVTTCALPVNQVRMLRLPQAQGPALLAVARIIRCQPIMQGFFDVGAQFVDSDPT